MQISSNINFRANHISTRQIQKLNPATKVFGECEANFVELVSKKDLEALRFIDRHWRARYSSSIFQDAKNKLPSACYYDCNNDCSRFFALTLQKDSYEDLLPDKILGVAELSEDFWQNMYNFDYIEAKPAYQYKKNKTRNITDIGKIISEEVKKIYKDRPIKLTSDPRAENFWFKQGYEAVATMCGCKVMFFQQPK